MGRTKGVDKKQLILRIPESLLAELYLLKPEMQDAQGNTKYGAISGYFERLIREDLERHKEAIRRVGVPQV